MATPSVTGSPVTVGFPVSSAAAATPVKNGAGITIQSILQSGQISGELKNLVSLLSSSANRLNTPNSPQTPLSANRKRPLGSTDTPQNSKRRRASATKAGNERQGKGLRHFSQKVCEKVRERGTTTYNEVAEELVRELSNEADLTNGHPESSTIDQKNIRRRVYDALNVLMAMNIISKEKKEIRWLGLPTNSAQECKHLEKELSSMEQRVAEKQTELETLLIQILSFKNLMKRNRERVASSGLPPHNSSIGLPFILVNTSKKTSIDCSISSDKSEYVFSFDNPFELYNDIDILNKMGLDYGIQSGNCTPEDLKAAKSLLPKSFSPCLDDIVANKEKQATPVSTPERAQTPPPQATPSALTPDHILTALGQTSSTPSPAVLPGTPTSGGIPSPQAVTALVSSVMRGSKLPLAKSPALTAKALLHNLCPSSNIPASPLIKSTTGSTTVQSPVSLSNPVTPQQKVVTVSKLASPEISSLLEQLQQSSGLSKLISTAAGSVGASRQLFTETKTTAASSQD